MYYHLDNFAFYDTVRTSGSMDTTYLSKKYTISGSSNPLIVKTWSAGRIGLGTNASVTGYESVCLNLGSYLQTKSSINITQRLLDYSPNGENIGGLSTVKNGVESHLLVFGFYDKKSGFVKYVDETNTVRVDVFYLSTSLTGSEDVIEWGFSKSSNDQSKYEPFILWVNNKAAYADSVFCQAGSKGALCARVLGSINTLDEGTTATDKLLNTSGNTTVPEYGITDLVVNDGSRNGLIRVLNRASSTDIGPNSMTPSVTVSEHSDIVSSVPPDSTKYLTASTATAEEMYGARAFDNLSSEAILAFSLTVLASKNNPFALDLVGKLKYGSSTTETEVLPLDILPSYNSVILEKNPITNLPFTALEANGFNFGLKVT